MGKNNKKKDQKDTKDPVKLKVSYQKSDQRQELGNKAFLNKNYEEALECYTKAIELDPKEPTFYTNSKSLACQNIFRVCGLYSDGKVR